MNNFDFEGNRHGVWLEKNPDGSIKKQGFYIHGVFYTGDSYRKKQEPLRYNALRSLNFLERMTCQTSQEKACLKQAKQSIARLYQALKQQGR